MPNLQLILHGKELNLPFDIGSSIFDILAVHHISLYSACGGIGGCGLCKLQLEQGQVNLPTDAELIHLSSRQIDQRWRLACQVKPRGNVRVQLADAITQADWQPLPSFYKSAMPYTDPAASLAFAVDLGTTQIRISLFDSINKKRLFALSAPNPQCAYGADVLTRLMAACESEDRALAITWIVRNAVASAIRQIFDSQCCNPGQITQFLLVGNSAMLTLFSGNNYELLLHPDSWTHEIDCRINDMEPWRIFCQLQQHTQIELVQALGGFVGSDLIAGIAFTQLMQTAEVSLFIDFGTNTEMALWDGTQLWVTSVPGGPAFEGSGISCGMPAEAGAIFRVDMNAIDTDLPFQIIGHREAKGLCGSGLVDLIAGLLQSGQLNFIGKFSPAFAEQSFCFVPNNQDIRLSKKDIDIFQRAKAATGAGIQYLLLQADKKTTDLQRICVCGAFGKYLNVSNAQSIGLLPDVAATRVELYENSALAGCEFLLDPETRIHVFNELKMKSVLINMAMAPEFENLFIENLFLKPMRVN